MDSNGDFKEDSFLNPIMFKTDGFSFVRTVTQP